MKKSEVVKLLDTLECLFPATKLPDKEKMVNAWYFILKDAENETATQTIQEVCSKARQFPSAGEFMTCLNKVQLAINNDPKSEYQRKMREKALCGMGITSSSIVP